jgi:hypothetical protein
MALEPDMRGGVHWLHDDEPNVCGTVDCWDEQIDVLENAAARLVANDVSQSAVVGNPA